MTDTSIMKYNETINLSKEVKHKMTPLELVTHLNCKSTMISMLDWASTQSSI